MQRAGALPSVCVHAWSERAAWRSAARWWVVRGCRSFVGLVPVPALHMCVVEQRARDIQQWCWGPFPAGRAGRAYKSTYILYVWRRRVSVCVCVCMCLPACTIFEVGGTYLYSACAGVVQRRWWWQQCTRLAGGRAGGLQRQRQRGSGAVIWVWVRGAQGHGGPVWRTAAVHRYAQHVATHRLCCRAPPLLRAATAARAALSLRARASAALRCIASCRCLYSQQYIN